MAYSSFILSNAVNQQSAVLEEIRKGTESGKIGARKRNMRFKAPRTVPREKPRKHELLKVATLTDIKTWNELFADYADTFIF